MAYIGCLGEVAFSVSSELVQTLSNMQWSGSARISTHSVHGGNALTEFCGLEPDGFSFNLVLSSDLGANPMEEMVKLWKYQRKGIAVPLTIGGKGYGKYRWLIKALKHKLDRTDRVGEISWATVTVTLVEYLPS